MTIIDPVPDKKYLPLVIFDIILIMLIILAAALTFYVTPYQASNLRISPDSVEYAIGGHNIATKGKYFITVNGQNLPSRYPPWFSMFFLAPAYLIFGEEIGNGIYTVTITAILGVLIAFLIGRRISGMWGGILSGLAMTILPLYREYTTEIMTDIPCCMLVLLAGLLYIHLRSTTTTRLYLFFEAGSVIAMASAIRPVSTSTIFPFLLECISSRQKDKRIQKLALMLLPVFIMTAANLLYNYWTFGSPIRNGYNYWCAIPFDFTSMCFSLNFLAMNVKTILATPLPALIFAFMILFLIECRTKNASLLLASIKAAKYHLLTFTIIATLPMIMVHLIYFFDDARFYLPAICLLVIIVASMAGKWITNIPAVYGIILQIMIVSTAAILTYKFPRHDPPTRLIADQIANNTPTNAIIISSLDPAYLDFFVVRSTQRQIIPLSRNVEYASKVACPEKINNPQPPTENGYDLIRKWLLANGAKDIFPITADEGINFLKTANNNGRPVYLETSLVVASDIGIIRILQENFTVIARGGSLYQLTPKMTQ